MPFIDSLLSLYCCEARMLCNNSITQIYASKLTIHYIIQKHFIKNVAHIHTRQLTLHKEMELKMYVMNHSSIQDVYFIYLYFIFIYVDLQQVLRRN